MDNTNLDRKLTRIETSITSMRADFDMKGADTIEKVAARAIAGPQAEECMKIYDLLDRKKSIKDIQYSAEEIAEVEKLMNIYLQGGEE